MLSNKKDILEHCNELELKLDDVLKLFNVNVISSVNYAFDVKKIEIKFYNLDGTILKTIYEELGKKDSRMPVFLNILKVLGIEDLTTIENSYKELKLDRVLRQCKKLNELVQYKSTLLGRLTNHHISL